MSFRDPILYSRDTITIEEVHNGPFSKEKIKHLIEFDAQGEGLIVHSGYERGRSKSNFNNKICNYYKKNGHIKKDCYKLL